jgi:hypothetical protein
VGLDKTSANFARALFQRINTRKQTWRESEREEVEIRGYESEGREDRGA